MKAITYNGETHGCIAKRIAVVFKELRHDLQRFRTNEHRGWQNFA